MSRQIVVYGTDWCGDTRRTREHLNSLGLDYQYVNIEENPAAEDWVREQNDGKQKMPTVDLGGFVLSVPSNAELDIGLRRQGILRKDNDLPDGDWQPPAGAGAR